MLLNPRQMDWAFVIGQSLGLPKLDGAALKDRVVRKIIDQSVVNPNVREDGIAIDAFDAVQILGENGDLDDYFFETESARVNDFEAESRVVDAYPCLSKWLGPFGPVEGPADVLPSDGEDLRIRNWRWQLYQEKGLAYAARQLLHPMREYFERHQDDPRLFPHFTDVDPRD